MFNQHFAQELANLRDLGTEFAKLNPAVAPMLSGLSTDPDVERLLEGVAFLTGLLRQRLDDDFPEIIHELFQLIWPHYLRPLPSASIVAFTPKEGLRQIVRVPKGVQLASEPVEGTACLFRTCYDVEVHPLVLTDALLEEQPGRLPVIRLRLSLKDIKASEWQPKSLQFYLAGDPKQAADIYLLLRRYLRRIVLSTPDQAEPCVLTPNHLKPVGFDAQQGIIPYPAQSFIGYRTIQEYFILPEKFLFLELYGFDQWVRRGEAAQFDLCFELAQVPFDLPRVRQDSFVLAATPVINLFDHDADPIRLDHRRSDYPIRPSGSNGANYQVYNVEKVTGFVQGTAQEKIYAPFELFAAGPDQRTVYHTTIRSSQIRAGFDFFLSVAYPPTTDFAQETLSIQLQCTNGLLPEAVRIGDIRHPTSSTPEFVEFHNLRPPTPCILPPLGHNQLWQLISHLCLNHRSLANVDNLKTLLSLYNFEENRDRSSFLAHQKRIAGIQALDTRAIDRLVGRVVMRGREVCMDVRQDHFAGPGDLYLFGTILDHFLGLYASLNTYTQLTIKEILKGEKYQWPPRIGDRSLL